MDTKQLAKFFIAQVINHLQTPNSPLIREITQARQQHSKLFVNFIPDVEVHHWRAAYKNRSYVERKLSSHFDDVRYYFILHTRRNGSYIEYYLEIRWRNYLKCC